MSNEHLRWNVNSLCESANPYCGLVAEPMMGAFSATPKTRLCGGSVPTHGLWLCAGTDGRLRWPRPSNPLRNSTSGLPEVNGVPARSLRSKLQK
jgi:hypothetical protein